MKTEIGLWIDHRKAVVVKIKNNEEEVREITSHMEKHVRFSSDRVEGGAGEDVRDRAFENHLGGYYDEVIALLRDADEIRIFGPGEAKGELERRIRHAGLKAHLFPVEAADKMTVRQIAAKVRDHPSA